nr:MAG TPA: hypothetical protein [Caudoviricetes sp.]
MTRIFLPPNLSLSGLAPGMKLSYPYSRFP